MSQTDLGHPRPFGGTELWIRADGQPHRCRIIATRFTDPDAFATALARGAGHGRVREALEQAFDPDRKPREVKVPTADLLGQDGYRYCTGWRPETAGVSRVSARRACSDREARLAARAEGRTPRVPEPRARPVATFEGGSVLFAFGHDHARGRYEIATMFPDRPKTTSSKEEFAMASFYWEVNPDGPFATLIAVAATYLEPENYDVESLQRLAGRPGDHEMSVFKEELREAIRDPGRLPGDELFRHVEYDDGSDEAVLQRLWRDLYGDEPVTAPGQA